MFISIQLQQRDKFLVECYTVDLDTKKRSGVDGGGGYGDDGGGGGDGDGGGAAGGSGGGGGDFGGDCV